ncbi:MTH938/NDUFAF3 family protein [Candidatus Berkiella aquae]|uniref:NADH dehydrogenase [ubiquinone] 1 alpha subcomplex assembly factor 3 n=1 Tax=Candidatus Berkiella aquae TaxID=295108 RepID=A0A0Q9YYK9_9GAMM|nr:MTH938/NDUFAF3 family protein [Candidatus Berkiella aquae]MCS5711061.1 hypothetical protein [Candidatus Berkiella aquae]
MHIQQDETTATYQIKRYEPGKIWINEACYEQSVIIRPHQLIVPWEPNQFADLTTRHFESLYDNKPDILLLGTGEISAIPSDDLLQELWQKGIGIEFMDSRRACFTYTVLAAEERNVAACIIIQ